MEAERRFVARAIKPLKKDPPKVCSDTKTINFDTFKTTLFLFKDTRKEAMEYVEEVLPTLVDTATSKEAAMRFYASLDHQWLEFHYETNTLFLCCLKNSKP